MPVQTWSEKIIAQNGGSAEMGICEAIRMLFLLVPICKGVIKIFVRFPNLSIFGTIFAFYCSKENGWSNVDEEESWRMY